MKECNYYIKFLATSLLSLFLGLKNVYAQDYDFSLPITPIWFDDFDKGKVDTLLWNDSRFYMYHTRFWPEKIREQQYYIKFDDMVQQPENNYVFEYENTIGKDILSLTATPDPITAKAVDWILDTEVIDGDNLGLPNLRTFNYRSGELTSRMKFKYGIYVLRFKMPKGCGFWPAFWLYSGTHHDPDCVDPNFNPFTQRPCNGDEIDFFEWESEHPTLIPANIHYDDQPSNNLLQYDIETNEDLREDFHILLVEWQPLDEDADGVIDNNVLNWYFDPSTATYPLFPDHITQHKYDYPMTLIINNAIGGPPYSDYYDGITNSDQFVPNCVNGGTSIVGPAQFPAKFSIDHVAVFYRIDCDKTVDLCSWNPETDQSAYTGGTINVAGENCGVTVPGYEYYPWGAYADGKDLRLIAAEKITLKPGFHAKKGSRVLATVRPGCEDAGSLFAADTTNQNRISPLDSYLASLQNKKADYLTSKENKRDGYLISDKNIQVFPNPSTGIFTLKYPEGMNTDEFSICVYDNLGRAVFSQSSFTHQLDLSSFAKGIYHAEVYSGIQTFRIKLIRH